MSKFTLNQLTEGIRQRHMGAQHRRLTEKWARTGLLRGIDGVGRENMAVLLENQAAQLLRESSTLSNGSGTASGDLRGFSNIAFPIVRRVFGGLVANELVSIQPMSLPSGLLFYLDYTYGTQVGGYDADGDGADAGDAAVYSKGQSIYNGPAGKGVRSGSLATGGQYDLAGSGYSRRHEQVAWSNGATAYFNSANGMFQGVFNQSGNFEKGQSITASTAMTGAMGRHLQFDPQLASKLDDGTLANVAIVMVPAAILSSSGGLLADLTMVKDIALFTTSSDSDFALGAPQIGEDVQGGSGIRNVRRLNKLGTWAGIDSPFVDDPMVGLTDSNAYVMMTVAGTITQIGEDDNASMNVSFPLSPSLASSGGDTLVIPTFESNMHATGGSVSPTIPEIDIKIESLAVTAVTRKLRAKWSPELAQDLNAYHSLDAEVELTQILSEQIALELDREILNDLLTQANGANLYWSRSPGKFVNKETGAMVTRASSLHPGPSFTGTVREWYETLTETIIDCANQIHRKTLRGSANFCVVGPDVATILESSVLYRAAYSLDGDGQQSGGLSIGAEKVGTLSNRFTVYKDPYFPRNKILVGYKGGSYLETGYVYAPYVPLIVTPTIFAPEDFTPRKGVMTRYGKKMVRSDFYGTVTVMDLNII